MDNVYPQIGLCPYRIHTTAVSCMSLSPEDRILIMKLEAEDYAGDIRDMMIGFTKDIDIDVELPSKIKGKHFLRFKDSDGNWCTPVEIFYGPVRKMLPKIQQLGVLTA